MGEAQDTEDGSCLNALKDLLKNLNTVAGCVWRQILYLFLLFVSHLIKFDSTSQGCLDQKCFVSHQKMNE